MTARGALALVAAGLVAATGAAAAEPIAVVGARVHVEPGTTLERATVIVEGGKVVAVGVGLTVPAGARVIDGTDKVVTAGFIDSMAALGLVGVLLEGSSVDGRQGAVDRVHQDPIHAAYQARDGYDPGAVGIPVARAAGVTTVIATPAGGLVAGQSAAYSLADGTVDPIVAPAALHARLGPAGAGAVDGSRGRAVELLREVLDDARAYARSRAAYERNQRRHMIADRLDLDALVPVVRGRVPLVVWADGESDIRAALRLAGEFKLRLIVAGGAEAWRVAGELARAGVPVILDPGDNLPRSLAATDVRDDRAAVLARAGVAVAVSSLNQVVGGGPVVARQLAGIAVARGLTWDQALAALTTVPAAAFGLRGRGTVGRGAVADLVVWSGDPFELSSAAEVVIIGGTVQPLVSHQTRLLDRYRTLPAR